MGPIPVVERHNLNQHLRDVIYARIEVHAQVEAGWLGGVRAVSPQESGRTKRSLLNRSLLVGQVEGVEGPPSVLVAVTHEDVSRLVQKGQQLRTGVQVARNVELS